MRKKIPIDVARKMAQKGAIRSLIKESQNNETQMMLKIGKFDTLKEAINELRKAPARTTMPSS